MPTAAEVVREWKRRMRAREFDHMGDVVDLEGYTEVCLGLTGWTTGCDVAFKNYRQNMIEPWSDVERQGGQRGRERRGRERGRDSDAREGDALGRVPRRRTYRSLCRVGCRQHRRGSRWTRRPTAGTTGPAGDPPAADPLGRLRHYGQLSRASFEPRARLGHSPRRWPSLACRSIAPIGTTSAR